MFRLCLTALVLAGLAAPAAAQSLKVREHHADQERRLLEGGWIADMNETCGTQLPVSMAWEAFPTDDSLFTQSSYGRCENVLSAVKNVCSSDIGKSAVSSRLTGITCAYGAFDNTAIGEDGTLTVHFTWETPNLYYVTRDFLGENL